MDDMNRKPVADLGSYDGESGPIAGNVRWLMVRVYEYAEAYMWQEGYSPPKESALAFTEAKREALISDLFAILTGRHPTEVEA